MLLYALKRLLYGIPILFGVAVLLFVVFNVAAGSPAHLALGKKAKAEDVEALEVAWGYKQRACVKDGATVAGDSCEGGQWVVTQVPATRRLGRYLVSMATLDFGQSRVQNRPVWAVIAEGVGPSLLLVVPPYLIGLVLALLLALLVGFRRGTLLDRTVTVICVAGMSVSYLAYIIAGQYFLAFQADLFPIHGWDSEGGLLASLPFVLLPGIIYIAVSLGYDLRFFRTAVDEEVAQDYVRTARAKGLPEHSVMFKHVLRNALIPVITYSVVALPHLFTGSLLLEAFFGIPGLGSAILDGVNTGDFPVIQAITFIGSSIYVLSNIAADLLYAVVDPRVRLS